MIRNSHRLIAALMLSASLAGGSALAQLLPPANVPQQAPLPPPQQAPFPPPPQGPFPPRQAPLPPPEQTPLPPPQQEQPPAPKRKDSKAKQKAKDGKEAPPPQATPETMTQTPEDARIANPTATFSGLDKISGRIITFDVALNETVQFGALQVTPRACYTRPPTETQNTISFVEIDEITLNAEIRRIFSGWMFASSPGLNAVEHPIYDIWLIDCKTTPPSVTPSEGQQ